MLVYRRIYHIVRPLLEVALLLITGYVTLPFALVASLVRLVRPRDPRAVADPKVVAITGASSGIGAALARHYAAPGVVIAITSRDASRLSSVASDCASRGATVLCDALDVADAAAVEKWVTGIEKKHKIDLLFANSGTNRFILPGEKEFATASDDKIWSRVFEVNTLGVLHTVMSVLPLMQQRKRGQIVVVNSMAAEHPWVGNSYAASKAANAVLCQNWRDMAKPDNVCLTQIQPAFVRSRMTETYPDKKKLKMVLEMDEAIEIITDGVSRGESIVSLPISLALFHRTLKVLPESVYNY